MNEDIKNEDIKSIEVAPETISTAAPIDTTADDDILPLGDRSERRRHFRWYDIIVIIITFFTAQAIGAFIAVKIGITPPNPITLTDSDFEIAEAAKSLQAQFVAVTLLFATIICFSLLRIYSLLRGWTSHISFRWLGWSAPFRLLCGYLLLWCISITIEPLTSILPSDQSALGQGGWLLLSAVIMAPLLEEVVFRGYIAGGVQYAYGPISAWLVSSIIFGIAHGTAAVAITATFSGLVLGFYYMRYRSLMMVITLHAMNNLTACFLSVVDLHQTPMSDLLGGGTLYWTIYAVCAIITLAALVRMYNLLKQLKSDKTAY